jgi:hypothetical protein
VNFSILIWADTPDVDSLNNALRNLLAHNPHCPLEIIAGGRSAARLNEQSSMKVLQCAPGRFAEFVKAALSAASGAFVNILLPGYVYRPDVLLKVAGAFSRFSGLSLLSTAVDFSDVPESNPWTNSYGLGPFVSPDPLPGTSLIEACLNPPLNRIGVLPCVFFRRDAALTVTFDNALKSCAVLDFLFQIAQQGNYVFVNETLMDCRLETLSVAPIDVAAEAVDQLQLLKKYRQFLSPQSSASWFIHSLANQGSQTIANNFDALLRFDSTDEGLGNILRAALKTLADAPFSIRDCYERHRDNVALNQQKIDLHNQYVRSEEALQAEIARLNSELETLRNSSSWKLTAPIRKVKSAMSRRS